MAGEIVFKLAPSLTNLVVALFPPDGHYAWNGTSQVLWENLTLAAWRAAHIALVEKVLSTGEHTGIYVADFPAGVAQGSWGVVAYQGPNVFPYSDHKGRMSIDWTGEQQVAFPAGFEDFGASGAQNFTAQTFNIVAGDG